MPTSVRAWAAPAASEPLEPITIKRRDVGPHDVRIDIKFAGICHSDIHTVRGDWGDRQYPLVPGHEIAGVVAEVGDEVTKFSVGDHVGVGCMVNSCGKCVPCERGDEQYCTEGGTYLGEPPEHYHGTGNAFLRVPDGHCGRSTLLIGHVVPRTTLHDFLLGVGVHLHAAIMGGIEPPEHAKEYKPCGGEDVVGEE